MKIHLPKWLDYEARRREENEDALKIIYALEEKKQTILKHCIAETCGLSEKRAEVVLGRLIKDGYLESPTGPLTAEGKAYAIRIIRGHRLYEKYLAEHSGFKPNEWHDEACRKEHSLSEEEQDEIATKLGNPAFDPHGDPIPSKDGEIMEVKGKCMDDFSVGDIVKVVQVEDQPVRLFKPLQETGLLPGAVFKIEEIGRADVRFSFEGESFSIPLESAQRLKLELCRDHELLEELSGLEKLTSLKPGEEATIAGISNACRGVARRRLLDLGFVRGSRISIDLISPMGNPTAYVVRGTAIALRKDQSRFILIQR